MEALPAEAAVVVDAVAVVAVVVKMIPGLGSGPGLGIAYRPQLAAFIERRPDLAFIELLADNHFLDNEELPELKVLRARGLKTVLHSTGLSPGGASVPDESYLDSLCQLIEIYGAVLFSEHIAFVRAGGLEAGHLLPVKRSDESLKIIVENLNFISRKLPVPLAIENIASFLEWSGNSFSEAEFLARILQETDCQLLLDVSNLYANSCNNGLNIEEYLSTLPLDKIAYLHVAGGENRKGVYHDTHAHALCLPVLEVLQLVLARAGACPVLLERDDCFPHPLELAKELDMIKAALTDSTFTRLGANVF